MSKKLIIYVCSIVILSVFMIQCRWGRKSEEEKSLQGEHPGYSTIQLTEDLRIDRENWYPSGLEVDDAGNIFIFELDFAKIYIYDKHGNEVSQKEFKQGQGPGDINFMDPTFSSDGNLHIYDKKIGRLTVFNKNWEIINTREMRKQYGKHFMYLRLDTKNFVYAWTIESKIINSKEVITSHSLVKISSSGKLLDEFFIYRENADQIVSNVYTIHLYPPYGVYKLDMEDFLYFAVSDKYEINVISPQGKLVRKITKTSKTRKITETDTKNKISGYKKALSRFGNKLEFIIPERMPAIADFFVFENKYILVVTYENPTGSPILKGDLFDREGNFLSNIDVPRYLRWADWNGLFKKGAIYKKNYFYTIEYKDDDSRAVQRYRIDWH